MRLPVLSLAILVAGLAAAVLVLAPSRAEGDNPHHIVYLHIQGDGQTARAWYRGAPPVGTSVQEALDTLSSQGYRVVSMTPTVRQSLTSVSAGGAVPTGTGGNEPSYIMLLER